MRRFLRDHAINKLIQILTKIIDGEKVNATVSHDACSIKTNKSFSFCLLIIGIFNGVSASTTNISLTT
jgi:hypothetical protein